MGVFATRSPFRPNPLGLSSVRIARIEKHPTQGPVIHVLGADLMDGTPIYDIKPYIPYTDCHPEARGGFTDTHAIKRLQGEGMKILILDLCLNGGGYLGAAAEVASEFLEANQLVVYTEGRQAPKQELKAEPGGLFREGQLIVLVDEYTASAAEIVSGAVQDHDRGLIVGRRTFGKGLVQRPIDMPDGSMIRLTVSHYYTPSGRCIQKPYVKGDKKSYSEDINNRFSHGELMHLIMPDVFVPLDTTSYTPLYRQISRNNLITDAALRYTDKERTKLLKTYKKFDDFVNRFEVPTALTDDILNKAKEKNFEAKDEAELKETLEDVRFMRKALIAYNTWDRSEYFKIINTRSDIVKKALELIKP